MGEETFHHGQEPIYADLTRTWVRQGRTVPGLPDHEWHRLARAAPRFFPTAPGAFPGPRADTPGRHRRDD